MESNIFRLTAPKKKNFQFLYIFRLLELLSKFEKLEFEKKEHFALFKIHHMHYQIKNNEV